MKHYLDILEELKSLIASDERVIKLNKAEETLENDKEVMALSYNKDLKESYLNDMLRHFAKDSNEVKKANLEYFRAVEKLDSHPKVQEYLKAYKEVDLLYKAINEILFKDFIEVNKNACCRR